MDANSSVYELVGMFYEWSAEGTTYHGHATKEERILTTLVNAKSIAYVMYEYGLSGDFIPE